MAEAKRPDGIAGADLSDDDLDRELRHAHEKRHDIFVDGTAEQLRNLDARTRELEAEYLRRFGDRVTEAAEKSRNGT
jgi:hypothetical protein